MLVTAVKGALGGAERFTLDGSDPLFLSSLLLSGGAALVVAPAPRREQGSRDRVPWQVKPAGEGGSPNPVGDGAELKPAQ